MQPSEEKLQSIHLLSLTAPTEPGGALSMSVSVILWHDQVIIGGTYCAAAPIAQITVTVAPGSPLVILLT
jgi:hypothetical protein